MIYEVLAVDRVRVAPFVSVQLGVGDELALLLGDLLRLKDAGGNSNLLCPHLPQTSVIVEIYL